MDCTCARHNHNDLKLLRGNLPTFPDSTQSIPDDKLIIDDHPFPDEPIPVTIAADGFPQATNVMPGDIITLRSEDSAEGKFPGDLDVSFSGHTPRISWNFFIRLI